MVDIPQKESEFFQNRKYVWDCLLYFFISFSFIYLHPYLKIAFYFFFLFFFFYIILFYMITISSHYNNNKIMTIQISVYLYVSCKKKMDRGRQKENHFSRSNEAQQAVFIFYILFSLLV